jgi:hypothetical protein
MSPADDEAFEAFVRANATALVRLAGGTTSSGIFSYLPPTSANRKLLQVPIPRSYPRSNPLKS